MSAETVRRFSERFVWQHGLLIGTFTLLTLTGMPLKFEWWGAVRVMGGYGVLKWVHRYLGLVMILQGVVHVVLAVRQQVENKQKGGLWPTMRDVRDMVHDTRFLLGVVSARARYPRYSYINKFDYWGAFWGIAIMGVSGLVLWFPAWFSNVTIHVSHIAHTDEAVLAAGAIFVWHLYHVHTFKGRPRLNTVWLTGEISVEELRMEHPEEYEERVARGEI